ncbi:MAG: nucleotidyltransferase domain-containing protein [Clostridiales bacterium]|jgi:predicted nucleotidyltransferase|nr:nucleotidyltransferase domain-containing protein [Clostridiales bacterium]
MMKTDKVYTIDEIKEILAPVFKDFGVKKAAVFGSYARGQAVPGADVDLIIKTRQIFDLRKYYEFENAMRHALMTKVDVTFEDYINPFMKEDITKEAVVLYEE